MTKRLIDIILSGAALSVFLPFGLLIALILRCTGEGEIFFLQPRVGKNGKIFNLVKFATMLKDSPNMAMGVLTIKNDPRVLPFGKFLRKTKLNEVPQFWNVLAGDMSLIGPRPQATAHFDIFPAHVREEIIKAKPGLSGIGSIVFRDEENIMERSRKPRDVCYAEEIAPYKGDLEIWYIKNQSFWLDIKLMLLTAWVILFPASTLHKRIFKGLPDNVGCGSAKMDKCISEEVPYMPLLFITGVALVTILALIPSTSVPPALIFWDKAQHSLAYAALSITGCFAFPQKVKLVSIGLITHGAIIEILQISLTTTRFGDVFDWLADGVGVLIGVIVYVLLSSKSKGV